MYVVSAGGALAVEEDWRESLSGAAVFRLAAQRLLSVVFYLKDRTHVVADVCYDDASKEGQPPPSVCLLLPLVRGLSYALENHITGLSVESFFPVNL